MKSFKDFLCESSMDKLRRIAELEGYEIVVDKSKKPDKKNKHLPYKFKIVKTS